VTAEEIAQYLEVDPDQTALELPDRVPGEISRTLQPERISYVAEASEGRRQQAVLRLIHEMKELTQSVSAIVS
jgi:hypothetical protein